MVSMSVVATVTRATNFGKNEFRVLGLSSGSTASKEFGAVIDLTGPVIPSMPIAVVTPHILKIEFYVIQVTSGTALIRLVSGIDHANYIDLPISGTMICSGQSVFQILVINVQEGSPYIEIFGFGS